MNELASLGTTEVAAIVVLSVIQIALLVWALIDIMRRKDSEVSGEKRWVWILVVLFVNMIGPIIYFLVGRKPKAVEDPMASGQAASADRTRAALDALYGDEDTQ